MKKTIILFLIFLGASNVIAQSEKLQAMEQELVYVHNTAKQMWLYSHNTNYDFEGDYYMQYNEILTLIFGQFDKMLNKMLVEDRDMTYPFAELQNSGIAGTKTVWSSDSLMRVFSWMLPGGTQHIHGNAVQYKSKKLNTDSFSFDNEYNRCYDVQSAGYRYDTIYTLKNNDKTIYILFGGTKFSTRIVGYQLIAFSIHDELVAENIFEDENGNITNEVSVGYDIGCSYEKFPMDEDGFPRPTIDENKKTANLPEIEKTEEGECFTGKFIKYKFDGKKFKFVSN